MPIDKKNPNFRTLLEDYHNNPDSFVFFVGAGLSMPLFPSWKKFLTELVDDTIEGHLSQVEKNPLKQAIDSNKDFLDIAKRCADFCGKPTYVDHIVSKFDIQFSTDRIPPGYKALMELSPNTIITTNYDRIPDIASYGEYKIFTYKDISEAAKRQVNKEKIIIKIHGKVEDRSSIILNTDDYAEIMYGQNKLNDFFMNQLGSKKIIFIGSSFSDPHINPLIQKYKKYNDSNVIPHYVLLNESKKDKPYEKLNNIKTLEDKYAVKVIPYENTTDDHSEVVEFLRALNPNSKNYINRKPTISDKTRPPQKSCNNPPYVELNKSEENQLVKILMKYSSLNEEETLKNFLNALDDTINTEIKHNKDIEYQIHNIIDACLINNFNTQKLIELLKEYEKDQFLILSFQEALEKIKKQAKITPIPAQYINNIKIKYINLPDQQTLKTLYTACLPELMPDDHRLKAGDIHDFMSALAKLSLTKSTGKLPLFDFLIQLMPFARNQQKTKKHLQAWLNKANSHLNLKKAEIEHLLKPLEKYNDKNIKPKVPKRLYLLVELQADESADASFYINAWYGSNSKQLINISPSEETIELNELQEKDFMQETISELLSSARQALNMADNQLTIEFFLPFCLLNHPVEQWIAPGTTVNMAPIGTRFPIVVRSQERLRNEEYQPNWYLHKETNKFDKTESDTEGIIWKESEQPQSMQTDFGNAKNACLAMTFPYKANAFPESMLVQAICQGAPIAIWLRQISDKENIRKELNDIFSEEVLENLPERVRKWRSEKYGAEQSYQLALFWDDPKRVPLLHFNSLTQK